MIGLAGSSRTGKTTLAKAAASRLKINYHDASVTKIMKECGINGVADLSLGDRIAVQTVILDRFCDAIKKAPHASISDRTPLDMIGYMLGEVTMHNTPPELHGQIQAYVQKCLRETERCFDFIAILRPLPFYKVEEGKPPENKAYQTLIQYIIEGAAMNVDVGVGQILTTGLDGRIESLMDLYAERQEFHVNETDGMVAN